MWPSWEGWRSATEHLDLVFVGIALAVIGSITSGFGMNLIKASHKYERHRAWYRRTRLIIGMSLACWVNTLLDVVAFALTPLAIVAPIGGVTIVAATLFARCGWTGDPEVVHWQQWAAISCVVTGVGVVTVCGPHPDPVLNTTEVLDHFHDLPFIAYQSTMWTAIVLCVVGLQLNKIGQPKLETTLATGVTAGLCSGVTQTMMKVMSVCVADFFITGALPFLIPEFWMAIAELIVVALVLFYLLQICLGSAPLSLSSPLYMVSVILFTVVAATAFYGDLTVATKTELVLFTLGVMLVVTGMGVLIAWREENKEERLLPVDNASADKAPAPPQPAELDHAEDTKVLEAQIVDPDPDL
jgi:hypothetical protein